MISQFLFAISLIPYLSLRQPSFLSLKLVALIPYKYEYCLALC